MDSFKRHANNKKRKFHTSEEQERTLKKKDIKNDKFTTWFRGCCAQKKHPIKTLKNKNTSIFCIEQVPLENESINLKLKLNIPRQLVPLKKISNDLSEYLKSSSSYVESKFCQNIVDSYDDPCINCIIQYGPDFNEDIYDYLRSLKYQTNKDYDTSILIEDNVKDLDEKINNNDQESSIEKEKLVDRTLSRVGFHVNSFINNIIGDGVDRVSEIIKATSTYRKNQFNLKIDDQLNKKIDHINITKQNQYPGLLFEKQNFTKSTPNYCESSIQHSLDNQLLETHADNYHYNSVLSSQRSDQQSSHDKISSSQNQEPYNWDRKEYSWPIQCDSFENDHLVNKSVDDRFEKMPTDGEEKFIVYNDNDDEDLSYSVASVLPFNKTFKMQSDDDIAQNLSGYILHVENSLVISNVRNSSTKISNDESKKNHSHRKIFLNDGNGQIITVDNNSLATINSNVSSKANKNTSKSSLLNHGSYSKHSLTLNDQESSSSVDALMQQNDRFSTTSVGDLFMQIGYAKTKKSIDSKSNNTDYSMPISLHSSVLSDAIENDSNKNNPQISRATITSSTKTNFNKNLLIMKGINRIQEIHVNLSEKSSESKSTNEHDKQTLIDEIDNNINQTSRSTYDDIMCSWRRFLQRLAGFILPPIHNNTAYYTILSSSIMRPDGQSWPRMMPTRALNIVQSNNISSCWGQHHIRKQTPGTSIFTNERLSTSYSMETNTNKKQMCISIQNSPCYSKYYSCLNRYHCCCSSPITINNCSSSF